MRRVLIEAGFVVTIAVALSACGTPKSAPAGASTKTDADAKRVPTAKRPDANAPVLDVSLLRRHTKALSDDAMQGRRPGTDGGKKAVAYISAQMKALGLTPAGEEGWTQTVPMRAVTLDGARSSLALRTGKGEPKPLAMGTEIVAGSLGAAGTTQVDAPLVFVGYGVTAPEFEWDDYADVDVRGKVVVVFVGDPPVEDDRFGGPAMTYYGRWTYKFERALEAGAAGCLVVHETGPASYGWNVVDSSWSGERFDLQQPGGTVPARLGVQGWIHRDLAERLAKAAGSDLAGWHARALEPDFAPVPLGTSLVASLVTTERTMSDVNVLGMIPGRDRPQEYVLITAHWDHLGVDPKAKGEDDAIFNGAIDNASGIAGMLGVGAQLQARANAGKGPGRSVVLLATTAEEQGLLGSRHYAAHPLVPAESIVAVANLDSMNVYGRTTTITVPGRGQNTLEDVLAQVAQQQGRTLVDDERPEAGSYFRSDHFSFAKVGIPAITFRGGKTMEEGGSAAGEAIARAVAERYHTVADNYDAAWSFEGALQDAQAVLEVVTHVADAAEPPRWNPGRGWARPKPAP
ncbi:MAG: M28 family peptidase [Deltaproteobacteria bacterium]|nr:M28 family peptidase [Deltaproteobacteria bacterium]